MGFRIVERFASDRRFPALRVLKGGGLPGFRRSLARETRGTLDGTSVEVFEPLAFMNRSGGPVARRMQELGLAPADLLVCYDELALPLGRLRIRPGGSAAGHNGMRSLIDALGTDEFPRLRFGIRPDEAVEGGADFVLSPFRPAERRIVDEALGRASEAVACFCLEGVERTMARYNPEAPPAAR